MNIQKNEIEKLKKDWQEAFPDALVEVPSYLKPLIKQLEVPAVSFMFLGKQYNVSVEEWHNDTYAVTKRILPFDSVFKTNKLIILGIAALDGTAKHDWRDFQAIKNQLAGENCEAFELYPSENRLIDPSNYFILWCFPEIDMIKVGQLQRFVLDQDDAFAPQRKFQV